MQCILMCDHCFIFRQIDVQRDQTSIYQANETVYANVSTYPVGEYETINKTNLIVLILICVSLLCETLWTIKYVSFYFIFWGVT